MYCYYNEGIEREKELTVVTYCEVMFSSSIVF